MCADVARVQECWRKIRIKESTDSGATYCYNLLHVDSWSELIQTIFLFNSEFYEYHALMMEEEGAVIVGLLVGLNVIDANLCVKGEDLDSQVSRYG